MNTIPIHSFPYVPPLDSREGEEFSSYFKNAFIVQPSLILGIFFSASGIPFHPPLQSYAISVSFHSSLHNGYLSIPVFCVSTVLCIKFEIREESESVSWEKKTILCEEVCWEERQI